jgi:hypothetical protein
MASAPPGGPIDPRIRAGGLLRHAEQARARAAAHAPSAEEYADLQKRLDRLEVYAEQAGRQSQLIEKLNDYVGSLQSEVRSLYWIRIAAISFAGIFVVSLCLFSAIALSVSPKWVAHNHTHAVAALIVATVGASVALIALVLKGAFRTIGERNDADLLPENLKVAVETVKTFADAIGGKS